MKIIDQLFHRTCIVMSLLKLFPQLPGFLSWVPHTSHYTLQALVIPRDQIHIYKETKAGGPGKSLKLGIRTDAWSKMD